jgi:hypothetical protein
VVFWLYMAFTWAFVSRRCPESAFAELEAVVAEHVGHAVYAARYPDNADVDVAAHHATLATYMALKIEIDTEDLPTEAWTLTESGLWLKPDGGVGEGAEAITDKQRNAHFEVLGQQIRNTLAADTIWESGEIGWNEDMNPARKLGVLVSRAEGAWVATYTD